MAKTQSFTKEQFVDKANIVHNFKYKYTTTVYNGATKNVDIICPIHGIFTQKAYSHLQGHGCPKCATKRNADNMLMTKEDFVKKPILYIMVLRIMIYPSIKGQKFLLKLYVQKDITIGKCQINI